MVQQYCILVDEQDNQIGLEEKMATHERGLLHRAFSILVFNSNYELLLQQRATEKYHCGGLWTNTVCSHQQPGETTIDAAHRRIQEEFGFDCALEERGTFIYQAPFTNGLAEYEFDHVLFGTYDGTPNPNPDEIADYAWVTLDQIRKDLQTQPQLYTPRFGIIMEKFCGL